MSLKYTLLTNGGADGRLPSSCRCGDLARRWSDIDVDVVLQTAVPKSTIASVQEGHRSRQLAFSTQVLMQAIVKI